MKIKLDSWTAAFIAVALFLTGCASQQVHQTQQNINQTANATASILGSTAMVVYAIRNFHP